MRSAKEYPIRTKKKLFCPSRRESYIPDERLANPPFASRACPLRDEPVGHVPVRSRPSCPRARARARRTWTFQTFVRFRTANPGLSAVISGEAKAGAEVDRRSIHEYGNARSDWPVFIDPGSSPGRRARTPPSPRPPSSVPGPAAPAARHSSGTCRGTASTPPFRPSSASSRLSASGSEACPSCS